MYTPAHLGSVRTTILLFIVHVVVELGHTALWLEVFQEVWNRLISLEQDVDKALRELFVALVVERSCAADVTDAVAGCRYGGRTSPESTARSSPSLSHLKPRLQSGKGKIVPFWHGF